MDYLSITLIAFGLAMDAFAVSIASGVIIKQQRVKHALLFGFMFGSFQMLMPILGWSVSYKFHSIVSQFDHWIAFILLFAIGAKMIWEAFHFDEIEDASPSITIIALLTLSIATSIDALAVGISFAFLNISIIMPVIIIGIITFLLSFAGIYIGSHLGHFLEKKIEILGGIILILIGFKILISHLMT